MVIRIWEFQGRLSSFKEDLIGESLRSSIYDESLDKVRMSRSGGGELLIKAVSQGDLAEVRELLDLRLNWTDDRHDIVLGPAASGGFVHIVYLLLDRGVPVHFPDRLGATPLMQAARNGRTEIAKLLFRKGADVTAKDHDRMTALHHAAARGGCGSRAVLLEKGMDVKDKNSGGQTALQLAEERGHTGTVSLLKSYGAQELSAVGEMLICWWKADHE